MTDRIKVETPCPPGCTSGGCTYDHYRVREVESGVLIERVEGEWVITTVGDIDLGELRMALGYLHA